MGNQVRMKRLRKEVVVLCRRTATKRWSLTRCQATTSWTACRSLFHMYTSLQVRFTYILCIYTVYILIVRSNVYTIYVYYIASKVFEDRLVNRGLHAEFPDFESVYHLVIDAVDTYNEGWERAFKEQEVMKVGLGLMMLMRMVVLYCNLL